MDNQISDVEFSSQDEFSKKKKKNDKPFFKLTSIVRGQVDRPLLVIILFFLGFGSAMVFSASYAYAYSKYGDSAYFIRNQLVFVLLGLSVMIAVSLIDYHVIKKWTPAIFLVSIVLLLLVLVIGISEGEGKRWLNLGISFQPSEIAKISIILMLAWYFERMYPQIHMKHHYILTTIMGTLVPGVILLFVCGLVYAENHVSGTIIIGLIGLCTIWVGGGKKSIYIVIIMAIVAVIWALLFFSDQIIQFLPNYAQKRVDMWLNPENYNTQDDTWQTVQGLIAVGSGGIFGRGFGQSLQKHGFISQPQNDFIFAVICEELGFVGALCIIALYLAFIWRGLYIARRAPDTFSAVTASGIVAHVGIQAFLNMMVVTSIIPNTGITLPFFSYGGSSLVILMLEMGVLLSISRYSRIRK
jgi:cell division protein FtsW